jgi:AcrR family transcriptional regulator
MARQERAELTRVAIIRAAAEAFDRFGYAGTSLSDITASAGVTKGALYFHFGSKEDLARGVIEEQHARAMALVDRLVKQGVSGLEAVIKLSYEFAEQLVADSIVRAGIRLTLEYGTFENPIIDPYRSWIQATEDFLSKAIEENDVRPTVMPDRVAQFIVSAFTGVQLVSQVLSGRRDLQQRVDEMWELVLPSLVVTRKIPHFRSVAAHAMAAR